MQKRYRNLACTWGWIMSNLPGWRDRELQLYLILGEQVRGLPLPIPEADVTTVHKGGEKGLRELLQPTLPAAAGEVVALLGSEAYTVAVPKSERIPGMVAVVRHLLGADIR